MPQVDGKPYRTGYDVARVGFDLQEPHRAPAVWLVSRGDPVHRLDNARCTEHGILAQAHWRWSCVRILPGDRDVIPAQPERPGYHADRAFFCLEDGPLL